MSLRPKRAFDKGNTPMIPHAAVPHAAVPHLFTLTSTTILSEPRP